jgi:hypothetical protein
MPPSVYVMQNAPSSRYQPRSRCVLYARVSSKEQEQEGYSIQAQLNLRRDYAARGRRPCIGCESWASRMPSIRVAFMNHTQQGELRGLTQQYCGAR